MTQTLTKLAFQTFQQGKRYFGLAHKTLTTQLLNLVSPPETPIALKSLTPELLLKIQKRADDILEVDWQDAERGVYPMDLLFENDWDEFFRYYPMVCWDASQIWERSKKNQFKEFPPEIDKTDFPNYYLQNFHHQTDGYLSDFSASLYDLQVDILFNGAADAMRRRVLAPLKEGLKSLVLTPETQPLRILDVACGTGRTLKFIRSALPKASLHGVDLSPAYLRKANQLLSKLPGTLPQLLQANAEELPYVDDYFNAITCVFLFHELPAPIRQRVIDQCFRVTKPGGMFVICDSIQLNDSPEFEALMHNFPATFHEPFYTNYIQDDLKERLDKAGFTDIQIKVHFMSKYWIARKPA
ncbi:MAG: methyltransferase domain-containing protein [Leptolyngbyaceae cyanobacterium bins.59]|nr:methyltransferase domain-containing protein [Leptolyngbyaceae cyanobacterium bins.59]